MDDLFERDQNIYNRAYAHFKEVQKGVPCDPNEFGMLLKGYGRMLRHTRKINKLHDKISGNLRDYNQDLYDKAHYDMLTGIYNRRYMEESLSKIISSLSRFGGMLSVLMMDIDFFKQYNDTYGHSEGDACLKSIAETLDDCMKRTDDFVARYGGEEFIAILPNTDEAGASAMASRILEQVRELEIPHSKSLAAPYVTLSVGVTTGLVEHPQRGKDYIEQADKALYMSKQNGRNQYTFVSLEGQANGYGYA